MCFEFLHIVSLLDWLSRSHLAEAPRPGWRPGGFRHLAGQAGAFGDYFHLTSPGQSTDWLLLPESSDSWAGVGMGRGCWHHIPCLPSSAIGRHQLATAWKPWPREDVEGGRREVWERGRYERSRWCWIRAGQLRLQLVWGTRRTGLAGGILKDTWLQMHSVPQSGSHFSRVCAGSIKNKISGSSRGCCRKLAWRPTAKVKLGKLHLHYNLKPSFPPLPSIRSANRLSVVNLLALKLFILQNHRNTDTEKPPGAF